MLVIGAKGFAKEAVHVINKVYPGIAVSFYDDVSENDNTLFLGTFSIIKSVESAKNYFKKDKRFVIGIGNPSLRMQIAEKMIALGGEMFTIISPSADIGVFDNSIGEGTIIMDNVIVETSNRIGKGCLIHAGTFISHDVTIGSFCEISPFVKLLGNVHIGNNCSIGTSAVILPKIKLGDNVIVGAGAVVNKDVPNNTTVVGIPAKPLIRK